MKILFCGVIILSLIALPHCSEERQQAPSQGSSWILDRDGVHIEASVPPGETSSIGSYLLSITFPDGSIQRIPQKRDGVISRLWLDDLGGDGLLDLIVWTTSAGSGSYGSVMIFQRRGGEFILQQPARLTAEQTSGYMGHDTYEVVDGQLYRRFPLYRAEDVNARPTGGQAKLRYSVAENSWYLD
ncbi:PliI family lysozyme inhibitor of I-type lysozyme [Candidatus Zixiibacteriota bacterium]